MAETWFRGEAAGGPVSTPGGHIQDFGDGMYLTDRLDVAREYAAGRAPGQPDRQMVQSVTFDPKALGRILDLRTDGRWTEYVRKDPLNRRAYEIVQTGRLNETYGEMFQAFLETYGLDRSQFDAIIGPEFVRGGTQLCIVNPNGQASRLAAQIRAKCGRSWSVRRSHRRHPP